MKTLLGSKFKVQRFKVEGWKSYWVQRLKGSRVQVKKTTMTMSEAFGALYPDHTSTAMNVRHLDAHSDYKPNSEHALPTEDENPDGFWLSPIDPFCTRLTQERFFKFFQSAPWILDPLDPIKRQALLEMLHFILSKNGAKRSHHSTLDVRCSTFIFFFMPRTVNHEL